MGSRLSSMLVQQGLLAVGDLQDAFTRQVVRGGALDTILLERELVGEDVLLSLLSKVTGITPMSTDQLERIEPSVAEAIPEARAQQLGICPVALSGGRFVVLLGEQSDQVAVEELAYELDAKLHASAATELRIMQGRAQLYGSPLAPRFARLLDKRGERPPLAATLRTKIAGGDGYAPLTAIKRSPTSDGYVALDPLQGEAARGDAGPNVPPAPDGHVVPSPRAEQESAPLAEIVADESIPAIDPLEESTPEAEIIAESPVEAEIVADEPVTSAQERAPAAEAREFEAGEPDDDEPPDDELPDDELPELELPEPEPDDAEPEAEEAKAEADEPEADEPEAEIIDDEPASRDSNTEIISEETLPSPRRTAPYGAEQGPGRRVTDQHPEIVSDQPTDLRRVRPTERLVGFIGQADEPPSPAPEATSEHGPLALDDALLAMTIAEDREGILLAVLRGMRHYLPAADLFVTKGSDVLVGRYSLRGDIFDQTQVRRRRLRLDLPSVVTRAAADGAIYIGPAPDTDASATVLLDADILSPHLAIVPIQLRGKSVCVLIGHHPDEPVPSAIRGPLDRLADGAAKALVQLILRKRRTTTKVPTIVPVEGQPLETQRVETEPAAPTSQIHHDADQRPLAASGEIGIEVAASATADDPFEQIDTAVRKVIIDFDTEVANRPEHELLADLDSGRGHAADILAELRRRGRRGIDAVLERFPGRLRFDRNKTKELPLVSECSTVLRVLMHLGRPVIPGLAALLRHGDDDIRFYATYLLSELTYPESVALLADQLHDVDPAVRQAAAYGLRRCKELNQYPEILQDLRDDLSHPERRPRRAAMEALAALGDVVATPSLVAQLRDPDMEIVASAHRALLTLTKQDCGMDSGSWRRWWEANRQRHRVEWLIDGLVHVSRDLRESSSIELRELTGIGFGYEPDLPANQREEIRRRYMLWWSDKGLLDFGRFT